MNKTTRDHSNNPHQQDDAAAQVIRNKLDKLYDSEPSAKEEIKEVKDLPKTRLSKHQLYMEKLSESGMSLPEIQTAWHQYYIGLPDKEKHVVWREFYASHEKADGGQAHPAKNQAESSDNQSSPRSHKQGRKRPEHRRSQSTAQPIENPKNDLLTKIAKRSAGSKKKAHFHSLLFGLGMGTIVVFILMFSFFNERIITPFIRPSQNVSATPIIVDPNNSGPVGPESKIIIPKINIEAPVVYDEPSTDEKAIQKALERGVVHYPITPLPGEMGNSVIVGHSSSNILNSGKYKFAFLLLKSLENGDTFIVQKDGKRYVYKIFDKFVVSPTDTSVLNPPDDGRKAIMTLITCDPPGMSTNRLIIQGEQIFPDPSQNKESSVTPTTSSEEEPEELPSNSPSLWSRLTDAIF